MKDAEKFNSVKSFIAKAREDPRITTVHISMYLALICLADDAGSISIFRHDVMPLCKVSGSATYHRSIRELHAFGYIKYFPSYNQYKGSRVEFVF